eukprot:3447260-Ditylum_brightwellii.AAC.1
MHGPNRTHNTKDCFELKQHAERANADTNHGGADKVTYKDLNALVNANVTINAFDNFCNLKADNSSDEESNHE